MIVLGIDPGTAKTGYAVVKINDQESVPDLLTVDCINTPAGVDMHHRLRMLHDNLRDVVKEYTPELMVIERLFFNTNVKTAMSVGQARGVPLLIAGQYKMGVYEYTALEAKSVLTGYGRADKKQMQEAVRAFMQLEDIIKPDDANDALAMALCFLNKDYANELKSKTK